MQHFSIHCTLEQKAFILWVSGLKGASRKNYSITFTWKFIIKCFVYCTVSFFFQLKISVKSLHSDKKYADGKTLRCLSVVWWIKTYFEQRALKTDLVPVTYEEQQRTCQRNILLYREAGRGLFPIKVVSKWNIDMYWRTRIWGKGLHAFMTAATISHNFLTFLKLDNKSIDL